MKPKCKEQYETNHCCGIKHCKNRYCNPAEKDCRECLNKGSPTIEEVNKLVIERR